MIQRLFHINYFRFLGTGLGLFVFTMPAQADEALEQARQIFPAVVDDFERQCLVPATLNTQPFTDSGGVEMVSFICWSTTDEFESRTGQWLGRLPISAVETFGESLSCQPGDDRCDRWLPILQTHYFLAIQQAEFQCAIRNGTLLTQFSDDTLAVRCGFFATTLYDNNGDNIPDYEDPVSVDIPLTILPLAK